jgi:glucose/arabinose dehydrogenase
MSLKMQSKLLIFLCFCCVHFNCKNEPKKPTKAPPTMTQTPSQIPIVEPATPSVKVEKLEVFELNTNEAPIPLFPHPVSLKKGVKLTLNMPEGFDVSVAYEGLGRPRFLTLSPDNRYFFLDMWNRSDNKRCKVHILEDWDETEHRFKTIKTYLEGLHNANQVAFYTDKGVDYIYVTESGKLTRYPYKKGDDKPSGEGQVILKMPNTGVGYKYGGWHMTRSLAFHNDKLYVSIGSGCNACVEKEEIRSTIMQMNPDGSEAKYYARGVRNAVGMKWIGEKLWVTNMGRDQIGPDVPEDMMHTIEEGQYYGFPFYYQFRGKILADKQFKDSLRPSFVKEPPVAFCGFKAHSAPLGFDYFKDFDNAALKNSFLVALHGSNMTSRNRGYSVVKVNGTNSYTDVITGFLPPNSKEETDRLGRPCDVMMRDKKSFFVTDDMNGVVYYFWKK